MLPMEHFPNCERELKVSAAILEQPVIDNIRFNLGGWPECRGGSLPQDRALKQARQCLPFPCRYSPQIDEG